MTRKAKEERTLVLIKPDGVKRGLVGEIVKRIEQRGLKIVALQMFWPNKAELAKHYSYDDKTYVASLGNKNLVLYEKYGLDPAKILGTNDPVDIGHMIVEWLEMYMTSGPVVKIIAQGIHAVEMVRKLVGSTMPSQAEMGTIRGDFSVDSAVLANTNKRAVRNLVHASGTVEEAEKEIALWFSEKEIHEYKRAEEDIMF